MTSVMPKAMPCIRCEKTLVKTGGRTGMCNACRVADPAMAEVQRENYIRIRIAGRKWMNEVSEPVPGRTDIRKVNFAKATAKPRKYSAAEEAEFEREVAEALAADKKGVLPGIDLD